MAYNNDETNEIIDNDDTKSISSISSTVSAARACIECPECKKELQTRTLIKHIRNFHPAFFDSRSAVYSVEQFDNLINYSLVYPFDWEVVNDFDEVESKSIYGCLACNSAFTVEKKGNDHCKLAKCKKDHIKAIKEYKKIHIKEVEKKNKKQEMDKIIPTYSKEKWTSEIEKAITTYNHYHSKLNKIIDLLKKNGDDLMFINKEIQMPSNICKWEWRDIEYYALPTIDYNNVLSIEYTKVALLIIELSTQIRVLIEGIYTLPLHIYSDELIDSIKQHPTNHWGNFCHPWIWLHYNDLCRF